MDGMRFTIAHHYHGTLAANTTAAFALPCNATLVEVSACASNDSDATIIVGTSADDNGIIAAATIGDSSAPKVFDKGDFDGALVTEKFWHGARGTIVTYVLDFDGNAGTAAQNVDVLLTFLEG